ncbi:type 2 isopentenyl-diphosphate Delta-isomerase [Aestuariivirga litoralis]|uniref:Isopentenyl-diphosphate delta-isomerase n=1 Tax=Aestuariivirga litoralis TaxID=2650924 RepID=A0A2W2C796_9HYPH|nr:type 2 isopentenyl-diphosphate Delta-isomerase [Aestuariivirga litoralis]PZF76063.1 type 2 isopentenyl-diphosphate Delta-isomerase [Aestuariivirga litoralis]
MSEIERRKRDHIDIVLAGGARHSVPAGFDHVRFRHDALPEVDYDKINLSTSFLGRPLRLPFLASSMTGGPDVSDRINRAIAEAAEQMGFAMGVGSQRISLTTRDNSGLGPELRRIAPSIPIYGNLGAIQLVNGMGIDEARRAVDQLQADALILHLNPVQEAVQPGGDRNWSGVQRAIEQLTGKLPVPVIAKEVGSGISGEVARRLVSCGVAAIDVAGAGGTSWAAVEGARLGAPDGGNLGEIFRDWGIPTPQCLAEVRAALPDVPLIASGGIRHGLDAAKAIRLGANLAAQAASLLPAAMQGTEAVVAHVQAFADALRITCLATGSKDLATLRGADLLP